jgi:hypothetical protein
MNTHILTFNGITLDASNLQMDKRVLQEVMDYFLLDENYRISDGIITDVDSFREAIRKSGVECAVVGTDGDVTKLKIVVSPRPLEPSELPKLECMASHMDGAHCGLGDWYPEIEQGVQEALNQGPDYHWTTGWYASKKEIASARISNEAEGLLIEASVSDDFDTPGYGTRTIPHTTDLEKVRESIYKAWDEAEQDQKDNRLYEGFSVYQENQCIEYYIKPRGDAFESPPGDCYHEWGFQVMEFLLM